MKLNKISQKMLKVGSLLRNGATAIRVANEVGMHPKSIRRLRKDPRLYDPELCKISKYSGRKPRLPQNQKDDVRLALLAKFSLSEHSIERARRIIREVSGIDYSASHVYRLLRQLKAKLPKGVLFGHYNHTKHRCNTCGALLVKRECLLCMIREIKGSS